MTNITENNKKIAKFLGWNYIPFNDLQGYSKPGWWKPFMPQISNDKNIEKLNKFSEHFSKIHHHKMGSNYYKCRTHKELRFYNDWNWLMLVVDKIESIDLSKQGYSWEGPNRKTYYNNKSIYVDIERNTCYIYLDLDLDPAMTISNVTNDNKLKATYAAILEFIDWHAKYLIEE